MREISAAISSKGQITLPVAVQRLLGVAPKGRVVFAIDDDQVRLVPARYTLDSVLGSITPLASDDFERQIQAAKEERAEQLVAELDHT